MQDPFASIASLQFAAWSKMLLVSELHDMLVAEVDLNTKGVGQNCPLPYGHSSRGKILSPCPSPLRCACGVFSS